MAKPRVFISSTYYDMKHIRASLDLFVDSLGYESVLSEKGDIAFTHDRPLDEACYREAESSDIFVLIVGGRYGTEASAAKTRHSKEFFDRYESITKKEYETAIAKDVPLFVLIEKGVYSEYQTFLRNKEHKDIAYAHVDSVNVFLLIDDILAKPKNNPVHTFEKFEEIEHWLREQWAGIFRELLKRQSQQQQLASLSTQVTDLKAVNETLKTYLEAMMRGVDQKESSDLIASEERRLRDIRRVEAAKSNPWIQHVAMTTGIDSDAVIHVVRAATSRKELEDQINAIRNDGRRSSILEMLRLNPHARRDLNIARSIFGLPPFPEESGDAPRPFKVRDPNQPQPVAVGFARKARQRNMTVEAVRSEERNGIDNTSSGIASKATDDTQRKTRRKRRTRTKAAKDS